MLAPLQSGLVIRFVLVTILAPSIVRGAEAPGAFDPVGDALRKKAEEVTGAKPPAPPGVPEAKRTVEPIVRKIAGGTETTVRSAVGGTLKTIETGAGQAVKNIVNAGGTVVATYEKTWKNIGDQTPRTLQDIADAAQAVVRFGRRQIDSDKEGMVRREDRVREGKPVDAIWNRGVEQAQATEQNFGKATRESRVINLAASTAAAAYGGPAGAAAYAAWSTYRNTGDANEALRAGVLAAITYEAGSVANMPTGTAGELLQKAAFTGAVGGIAVAAAGGTEADVKDAFLRSAGAVLVQGGTGQLRAYSPQAASAVEAVQCISTMDVDCFSGTTYVRDARQKIVYAAGLPKIEKKISTEVGRWTGTNFNTPTGRRLRQLLSISKLPKSEMIPLLRNEWVLTWTFTRDRPIKRNQPAVVLTYVGRTPPFTSTVSYSQAPGFERSYTCHVGDQTKRIKERVSPNECEVVYYNEHGETNAWRSVTELDRCDSRTKEFIATKLGPKGIRCVED